MKNIDKFNDFVLQLNDFAQKSDFMEFYNAHLDFYDEILDDNIKKNKHQQ